MHLLLGAADLTLAAPLTNALTAVWTAVTARVVFGEREPLTLATIVGCLMMLAGIALCVASRAEAPR